MCKWVLVQSRGGTDNYLLVLRSITSGYFLIQKQVTNAHYSDLHTSVQCGNWLKKSAKFCYFQIIAKQCSAGQFPICYNIGEVQYRVYLLWTKAFLSMAVTSSIFGKLFTELELQTRTSRDSFSELKMEQGFPVLGSPLLMALRQVFSAVAFSFTVYMGAIMTSFFFLFFH